MIKSRAGHHVLLESALKQVERERKIPSCERNAFLLESLRSPWSESALLFQIFLKKERLWGKMQKCLSFYSIKPP